MTSVVASDSASQPTTTDDACPRATVLEIFLPSLLLVLQCALTHPTFAHSRLSRWIRISLTPFNFYWFLSLPFRCSSRPSESVNRMARMSISTSCVLLAIKALELGFASGAYYTRQLKTIDGVKRWEKIRIDEVAVYKKAQEDEPCGAFKLMMWILLHFTSYRGLQFTWGPATAANDQSTLSLMKRIFRVNLVAIPTLAFLIKTRDSPHQTPLSTLLSMGVPNFSGLRLFSEAIYTACCGIWLASAMDICFSLSTIIVTLVYKLARWINAPESFLELCNPIFYPPIYHSPQNSSSLAEFWGSRWHSLVQRPFLILGGKPMVWITKKLGFSSSNQKVAGLFGIFAASAFIHEYAIFSIIHPDEPYQHILKDFPYAALYFIIQPFGILIEPYLIPLIPKKLGGGKLWVWVFSILSGYLFRKRYLNDFGIINDLKPISDWSWFYILSPIKV